MKIKSLLLLISVLTAIFTSCKKNKSYDLNPDINVADDVVLSECAYQYVFFMIAKAVMDPVVQQSHQAWIDSGQITFYPAENKYLFSFSGKLSADSVRRNGKFEAVLSGNFFEPETVTNVSFSAYFEDYQQIEGKDSIVNNGILAGNRMAFSNYISGRIIKGPDQSTVVYWESLKHYTSPVIVITPGNELVFYASGTGSGKSSKGYSFTESVTDSLVFMSGCPWILSGMISLSIPDIEIPTGTISFIPDDGCSDKMIYDFEGNLFYYRKTQEFLKN